MIVSNREARMTAAKQGVRVTKRRGETRQRLLDAALGAFADEGFGQATVERVCARAGYTRGAFYSNFASLDELFLAMWEQRSQGMLAGVAAVLAGIEAEGTEGGGVREVVEQVLRVIPVDDAWFRVNAEFTAHALRHPALKQVVAAREDSIAAAITPVVVTLLRRIGRTVPDREALGQALTAVHDGTAAQCLLEPDSPLATERRLDLFTHVVTAYSTESRD
jgi:AcrR family transcriptional regulator